MRIGLILGAHDRGGTAPRWADILAQVRAAEVVGFDLVTIPDAITEGPLNYWEGMTLAGAVAAASTRIGIVHSTVNSPMRPPALVARAAQTLGEISGGRYTLGIGAGNTPDDYRMFGIDADPRFSRFSDALAIITALLREGSVEFEGDHHFARAARFGLAVPTRPFIPINVAAGGPRMLQLTVRRADAWNWWAAAAGPSSHLGPILETIERECDSQGRASDSLRKTLDLYSVDPIGAADDPSPSVHSGTSDQIAESLLAFGQRGIDEVRIDIAVVPLERRVDAIHSLLPVVEVLHSS